MVSRYLGWACSQETARLKGDRFHKDQRHPGSRRASQVVGFASKRRPTSTDPGDPYRINCALDDPVHRRQRAHGVGVLSVARKSKGLAAAAAKVDHFVRTGMQGSRIQPVPRKASNAGERPQISRSGRSRTLQKVRPGMVSAAWQGRTLPLGVTFSDCRPQPLTHGLG